MRDQPIASLMTEAPVTIEIEDTLANACRLMQKHNCLHLPVMNREKVKGILSQRDISMALEGGQRADKTLVKQACVEFPYSVPPAAMVSKVLKHMLDLQIGAALIVEENDKLLGIFTLSDAAAALLASILESE